MDWKHHGIARELLFQDIDDAAQGLWIIHIRRSVQRHDQVSPGGEPRLRPQGRRHECIHLLVECIDHRISHKEDGFRRNTAADEVLTRGFRRGEEPVADAVRNDAVDLFWHTPVTTPDACLNMRDPDAKFSGRDRTGHRAGDITDNHHQVGWMRHKLPLEADHDGRRLLRLCTATRCEIRIRFRNAQLIKEVLGHLLVVMLSGMYQPERQSGAVMIRLAYRPDDRGDLHEIGPGTGYDRNAHDYKVSSDRSMNM